MDGIHKIIIELRTTAWSRRHENHGFSKRSLIVRSLPEPLRRQGVIQLVLIKLNNIFMVKKMDSKNKSDVNQEKSVQVLEIDKRLLNIEKTIESLECVATQAIEKWSVHKNQ